MALVFCDGFDHYQAAEMYQKWTAGYNGWPLNAGYIRPEWARPPGGMGYKQNTDTNNGRYVYKTLPNGTYATLVVGFNFKPDSVPVGYIAGVGDTADMTQGIQFWLSSDSGGHLYVGSGGTTLSSVSTNSLSGNTWYHIEFKVTIHNSTGIYEVRVDGTSTGWVPEATGKNTRQRTSNNYANYVALWNPNCYTSYDDLYVLDTSGSQANTFIGPQKIITVFPTGAGNSAQFTGNYAANFANVNETAGDGDATLNQSSTAGHIDLFDFDNVPTGTISAVQHVIQARQDAGAARVLRAKTRIGGTNYNGTSVNLSGSHRFLMDPVTLNPADSAAWEAADVNGAEFGYELVT